jgi:FMN phosphatase YigB (HAD superfamily)
VRQKHLLEFNAFTRIIAGLFYFSGMNENKFLILDLGGVLLNIDYHAPIRAFKKLGIEHFESLFTQAKQSELFDLFEKGKISNNEFRQQIRNISGITSMTDAEIDMAWNSILLDFPTEKMKLLNELKKKYRLFLLSNTNNIHIPSFENSMEKVFGKNHFHSHFEKVFYSSQIGMRKPDAEIFEYVIRLQNLERDKTIFIDDSIQHVEGAKSCGIKSFHLDLKKEDLADLLQREKII